jgi:IS30 family transposase
MKRGRRYGLSAEQKADIWRRWKAGESLHEIGRAFGKDHGSIVFLLSQHGGIAPAIRHRSQRTLVERHSRFTILVKVASKDTATVVDALTRQVCKLPTSLRRSLTWDRGLEMAKHKTFTVATKVNVYFCDPQSPWQRGTNENTNGLLRQYFPRKTDLAGYSQADLDKVALRLNQRPRKTLGFETPASKLQASVASTG